MKRFIALAAASMLTLSAAAVPAMAQYADDQLNPQDTTADTGSATIDPNANPGMMGVDNFVTRSIDNTFGLLTSGKGQNGIGACADTDQPRTPDATSGLGAKCE